MSRRTSSLVLAICAFIAFALLPRTGLAQGVDLDRHCKGKGGTGAINLDGTGYGWRCAPGNSNISIDAACGEQYGGHTFAKLKSPAPGKATDWICVPREEVQRRPMDLDRHCRESGQSSSTNLDGTGYGWRCLPSNTTILLGDVCRAQYGARFEAVLMTTPPGKAADWACRQVPKDFATWTDFSNIRVTIPRAGASGVLRVAAAAPPLPTADALHACNNSSSNQEQFYSCLVERGIPQQYRLTKECMAANRTDGGRAFACSTGDPRVLQTYDRGRKLKDCYDNSGGDQYAITQCVGDQVLNERDRQILRCITSNRGNWQAAAVCHLARDMTPEQQIAMSCAIESGGQPKAFAACTGGKLLVRELDKCKSGGIGTENGCFGPNNEFRKALNAMDPHMRNALGANSVGYQAYSLWMNNVVAPGAGHEAVKAVNTVLNDAQNGPGENNDGVKVLKKGEEIIRSVFSF